MAFRVLDDYPRRTHLDFYRPHPCPFYSVSFELDASRLRARARELGVSTYAALTWAFHRGLLQVEAFRVRLDGDDVVLHDALQIGMTVPGPRGTFTFSTHHWQADAVAFLRDATEAMKQASQCVDLSGGAAPDFAYYTALPGMPFTGFVHVPLDPAAGQPNTAFGKFSEREGRTIVPIGLTVNHRYVHGADLGALYEAASEAYAAAF